MIRGRLEYNNIPDFVICDEQRWWHNIPVGIGTGSCHHYNRDWIILIFFHHPFAKKNGGTWYSSYTPANVYIVGQYFSTIIIQLSNFQQPTLNMKFVSTFTNYSYHSCYFCIVIVIITTNFIRIIWIRSRLTSFLNNTHAYKFYTSAITYIVFVINRLLLMCFVCVYRQQLVSL